ncbi:Hypp3126 [Branchiostoma lanceolatum]|uniref:Hypp3126 protein n=1 Tax=Branchiostoma lanceolatum TaxID=7740 RepID=A0A8J9ZX20_BRALA|nr:Hypp3126 [Branchiostoma lanceolatum]
MPLQGLGYEFGNRWEDAVIVATAINDKWFYVRTGMSTGIEDSVEQYIFDVKEEILIDMDDEEDFKENFLRARNEHTFSDVTNVQDIVDTICTYEFEGHSYEDEMVDSGPDIYPFDHYSSTKQTPLCFALFGHSFLETQKSRVGWYCRDLAALEEKDEQEGSD